MEFSGIIFIVEILAYIFIFVIGMASIWVVCAYFSGSLPDPEYAAAQLPGTGTLQIQFRAHRGILPSVFLRPGPRRNAL